MTSPLGTILARHSWTSHVQAWRHDAWPHSWSSASIPVTPSTVCQSL